MLPKECGLFGICGQELKITKQNKQTNQELIYNCLSKLQHRGQDSFGYSYKSKDTTITQHYNGLVELDKIDGINDITDLNLIGHLRYITSGKSEDMSNIQPFISEQGFMISHNGNIKNTQLLHKSLISLNLKLSDIELAKLIDKNHDTYYLLKIIENLPADSMEDKLVQLVNIIPGVYCLIVLYNNAIYIVRDRYGVRPLCLGTIEINNKTQYMVASESVAFPTNSYFVRDVNPGEVIKMSIKDGFDTIYQMSNITPRHCLFEYIYFLKPDTISDDVKVSDVRQKYGHLLSKKEKQIMNNNDTQFPVIDEEHNIYIIKPIDYSKLDDYIVVGSPSSGIHSAQGYAEMMGIKYEQVIIKKQNIRSFIYNTDEGRIKACRQKFEFIQDKLVGKKLILGDDSLVRGNTMRIMIQILKELGVIEVHVRIASPPIRYPCYFGIDIPNDIELIAKQNSIIGVTSIIGADSLIYLDLDDIKNSHEDKLCHACFSGEYEQGLLEW